MKERINKQIRAQEVRVIGVDGVNLGVMKTEEALALAEAAGVDLIETGPNAAPPIVKVMDFGKYQYEQKKKLQKARSGAKPSETKNIQVKIGTGDHDLDLKAKTASKWLKEGHRIKVELFLRGRSKGMEETFLKGRLDRVLHFITEQYKIAEPYKKSPKGLAIVIERDKGAKIAPAEPQKASS